MFRSILTATVLMLGWSAMASAATLGDDGLHKADWMRTTFLDLREDLEEANADGLRLLVIIEQRGCIYCTQMHEDVFPIPEIDALLNDSFFVVQLNMFGDREVTDFDGEVLTEKQAIMKWGVMFTPTMFFLPESVPDGIDAAAAKVGYVPGALGASMTYNMLTWVLEHGYDTGENFQAYHARIFNAGGGIGQ